MSATTSSLTSLALSPFQHQSGWSPGDISNVVFGCIATVLGVLTILLTLWSNRRRAINTVTDAPSATELTTLPIEDDGRDLSRQPNDQNEGTAVDSNMEYDEEDSSADTA